MKWVLDQEGYKEHAMYQARLWYNAFAEGLGSDGELELEAKAGDMLIHFTGSVHKSARMAHWLDILENEPEKVNIPLANLTLHNDIKDFWTNLRTARQALHNITECVEADTVVQQVFVQHPELGDDIEKASKNLERLVYEEPFHQIDLREATQKAEAALAEYPRPRWRQRDFARKGKSKRKQKTRNGNRGRTRKRSKKQSRTSSRPKIGKSRPKSSKRLERETRRRRISSRMKLKGKSGDVREQTYGKHRQQEETARSSSCGQ